jgi:hypothetical protein
MFDRLTNSTAGIREETVTEDELKAQTGRDLLGHISRLPGVSLLVAPPAGYEPEPAAPADEVAALQAKLERAQVQAKAARLRAEADALEADASGDGDAA